MIEDTAGYKEMMRMNHGNFCEILGMIEPYNTTIESLTIIGDGCIRWALRVRGFNMLSVAVQMHSTLLSHTWMTAKQRKCC